MRVLPVVLLVVVIASQPACIAFSARAHVDAVSDMHEHGVQVGIDLGFGYAGERSAVVITGGADTGTAALGVSSKLDHVRLPADDDNFLGWRAGFGGSTAVIGNPSVFGLRLGSLFVLHDAESYDAGGEKCCFSSSRRLAIAASVASTLGGVTVRDDQRMTTRTRFGGSAGIGLELYWLLRLE